MGGVVQVAGRSVAATELAEDHAALVHHAHDVRLRALAEGQLVRRHERRLELAGELGVVHRRQLGPHAGDGLRALGRLAGVADAGRLVVGLEADAVQRRQRVLGPRLPRVAGHLHSTGPREPNSTMKPAQAARNALASGEPDASSRPSTPGTPAANAAVRSPDARTCRESSHSP